MLQTIMVLQIKDSSLTDKGLLRRRPKGECGAAAGALVADEDE